MGRISDGLLALFGEKQSSSKPLPSDTAAGSAPDVKQTNTADAHDDPVADCLSCKIIGTGTMLAASAYVIHATVKGRSNLTGLRRYMFYGQGISLTGLLLVLAGSRAFDKGLFDKKRQEETLLEGCKNDLKYMILSLGYDLPTFLQDSPDSSK